MAMKLEYPCVCKGLADQILRDSSSLPAVSVDEYETSVNKTTPIISKTLLSQEH